MFLHCKMMETIILHDKTFRLSISSAKISERIMHIAAEINHDLKERDVVFLIVLNGAFIFASDLLRNITFNCPVSFIKLASYDGDKSTGTVKKLIGLSDNFENKTVVIIEDIIESGNTLHAVIEQLQRLPVKEIKTVCLLYKPDTYKFTYPIDYIGFTIPNNFVVGYGLDYNGYGRNLNDIYTVTDTF
jgi:hypoxanthine phosphoribosyltransferase